MGAWTTRCRSRVDVVLVLLVAAAGVFPAGASARRQPQRGIRLSVVPSAQKLAVHISTQPRAVCVLRVSVKRRSAAFPAVVATKHGKAVITWTVPADAPSGRWAFSVVCRLGHKSHRTTVRFLLIQHGNGHGGLMVPGSGQLGQGTISDLGGKGGGSGQTCAPDLNGGTVCFTNDPFGYYQGGS
jgi:hypothetical protein